MRKDRARRNELELDLLLERTRQRRVIPFVGAGVSCEVLGGWRATLRSMWKEVGRRGSGLTERNNLGEAELLRRHCGGDLASLAKKVYGRKLEGEPLDAHYVLALGPWPALVTTNWDFFLERAWERAVEQRDEDFNLAPDLAAFEYHLRHGAMPVFLRKDVPALFAALKAGRLPPPLWKLHGDFSATGTREFVFGHGDYRHLMVRDGQTRELLAHLASEYSLLFYGVSLSDPDVLGMLDQVREHLGPEGGPHFWMTAKCSRARAEFLRESYGIRSVVLADFDAVEGALARIAWEGWRPGCAPARTSWTVGKATVELLPALLARPVACHGEVGVSAPLATDRTVLPHGGSIRSLLGRRADFKGLKGWEGDAQRAPGHPGVWLLHAQVAGAYGRPDLVFSAVEAFLEKSEAEHVELVVPAHARGGLVSTEAVSATLMACGKVLAKAPRRHVRICCRPDAVEAPKAFGSRSELTYPPGYALSEVEAGRLLPGAVLDRAARGLMLFRVVRRATQQATTCLARLDDTLREVAKAAGLRPAKWYSVSVRSRDGGKAAQVTGRYGANRKAIEAGVTDGGLLELEEAPASK